MKISLVTDAPRHNLALMRISSFYKQMGNEVFLNNLTMPHDLSYGSFIFSFDGHPLCEVQGGTGVDPGTRLPSKMQRMRPDYSLFPLDFSLGYTWEYCPHSCEFCVVPRMALEKTHRSIWEFHESSFKKICLLNNNTFSDPQWKETFEEIWDANLRVEDENGYDLRLMDEEKAAALKKTRFIGKLHFAWDLMKDEEKIRQGLDLAVLYKLQKVVVYVLVGFNTTLVEDLYRCQIIHDYGFDPFPMIYDNKPDRLLHRFRRFIYLRYYRKYKSLSQAWRDYK